MTKLTFDEALEALGDGRHLDSADIQARALARVVWVAEWHYPGCLCESFEIHTRKADAVSTALMWADGEEGAPRGMKTALSGKGGGRFDGLAYGAPCITTVYRQTLGDCF